MQNNFHLFPNDDTDLSIRYFLYKVQIRMMIYCIPSICKVFNRMNQDRYFNFVE